MSCQLSEKVIWRQTRDVNPKSQARDVLRVCINPRTPIHKVSCEVWSGNVNTMKRAEPFARRVSCAVTIDSCLLWNEWLTSKKSFGELDKVLGQEESCAGT